MFTDGQGLTWLSKRGCISRDHGSSCSVQDPECGHDSRGQQQKAAGVGAVDKKPKINTLNETQSCVRTDQGVGHNHDGRGCEFAGSVPLIVCVITTLASLSEGCLVTHVHMYVVTVSVPQITDNV